MSQLYSRLSDEIHHGASTTVTRLCILLQFLLTKKISPFLTTMWDHTDGSANQCHCYSAIYIISCLALEYYIIIDRAVGSPGYGRYGLDGLNAIDKQMLRLTMANLLNTKLIRYEPKKSSSCRFMKIKKIKL